MNRIRRAARAAGLVLLAAGCAALAYVVYVVVDANVYQLVEVRRLAQPAPAESRARPPIDGEPIGAIQIPRLDLLAIVVQGDSAASLRHAVGHLAGTALPGESGNVVLAGHRDTFFRPLKQVLVGDVITLRTRGRDYDYLVESTAVVPPSAVEVLQPTGGHTLTLITCFPFNYIGSAPQRFIVRARETFHP